MKVVLPLILSITTLTNVVSGEIMPQNTSDIITYRGHKASCDDVGNFIKRPTLGFTLVKNKLQCLHKCYHQGECEVLLFVNNKVCFNYGRVKDDVNNYVRTAGASSCFFLHLNPCQNGGHFIDGMCQCSKHYTGQYCELLNDKSCNNPFKMIHGYDENHSLDGYNELTTIIRGTFFKMAFVKDSEAYFTMGPADYRGMRVSNNLWLAQVQDLLSKADLSSFDPNPRMERQAMVHTGDVETVSIPFGQTSAQIQSDRVLRLSLFSRYPPYNLPLKTQENDIDEFLTALKRGYEPVNTVTFSEMSRAVLIHNAGTVLKTSVSTGNVLNPLQINSDKVNEKGEKGMSTQGLDDVSSSSDVTSPGLNIVFDPCWFDASSDLRKPQTKGDIHYLKTALQNGKRARVVFDGISGKTRAIYITDDYVLFQVSPYIGPKYSQSMNSDPDVVHSVVSTDGRVKTCTQKILDSTATDQSDYVADDVTWFVDSRAWELIYETEINGTFVTGNLEELEEKVNAGVDVHVVVQTPDVTYALPGGWMSTDPWQTTQHDVSAEVKNVLVLTIDSGDFGFSNTQFCTTSNILISTNKGWEAIEYTTGPSSSYNQSTTPPSGKIKWFVSGYD